MSPVYHEQLASTTAAGEEGGLGGTCQGPLATVTSVRRGQAGVREREGERERECVCVCVRARASESVLAKKRD